MISWLSANWGWLSLFLLWLGICVAALIWLARGPRRGKCSRDELRLIRDRARREHTDVH